MTPKELTEAVKETVVKIHPRARVFLLGSHDEAAEAVQGDWEFLVLLAGPETRSIEQKINLKLNVVAWACGASIKPAYHNRMDWDDPEFRATDLYRRVMDEGREL